MHQQFSSNFPAGITTENLCLPRAYRATIRNYLRTIITVRLVLPCAGHDEPVLVLDRMSYRSNGAKPEAAERRHELLLSADNGRSTAR